MNPLPLPVRVFEQTKAALRTAAQASLRAIATVSEHPPVAWSIAALHRMAAPLNRATERVRRDRDLAVASEYDDLADMMAGTRGLEDLAPQMRALAVARRSGHARV